MAHKISITVSDEMKKRLDDYRFGHRIDKFQTAVLDVINAGLQVIETSERNEVNNDLTAIDSELEVEPENNHQNV